SLVRLLRVLGVLGLALVGAGVHAPLRPGVVHPELAVHLHDVRGEDVLVVELALLPQRQGRLVAVAFPLLRLEPALERGFLLGRGLGKGEEQEGSDRGKEQGTGPFPASCFGAVFHGYTWINLTGTRSPSCLRTFRYDASSNARSNQRNRASWPRRSRT